METKVIDVDILHREGVAMLQGLSTESVGKIMEYLNIRQKYNGHVKQRGLPATSWSEVTCWGMNDILLAPYIFEYALELTKDVERYLQQPAFMYSLNAFTTYCVNGPLNADIQEYHRDKDDSKFLAMFIYLSDVLTEECGAHQFLIGSHNNQGNGAFLTKTVLGPAGTAFIADTRGLHRGVRPAQTPRSIAWVRWGVSKPPASYVWDMLSPIDASEMKGRYPKDEYLQESVQFVVK